MKKILIIKKKNYKYYFPWIYINFITFFLMFKKSEIFNCDYLDLQEKDIKKPYDKINRIF